MKSILFHYIPILLIQSTRFAFVLYLCGYEDQNSSFQLKLKYFSGGIKNSVALFLTFLNPQNQSRL